VKLTEAQKNHLLRIAAAPVEHPTLPAGWANTKAEQALEAKGLVRHWTEQRRFGGKGAIGQIMMTWSFCEATDDGYRAVSEILK
jgi:hypothetical protein